MKSLCEYILDRLEESILSSNNAGILSKIKDCDGKTIEVGDKVVFIASPDWINKGGSCLKIGVVEKKISTDSVKIGNNRPKGNQCYKIN